MVTFSFPKESWWPVDLTHTGEKFIIYCNANCKTENIIYLLECAICGLQYIGETKQQLSKRLNGHRNLCVHWMFLHVIHRLQSHFWHWPL
jgi:hypothetical protein